MKSLNVVLIVVAAAAAGGCTPDWAKQNETGLIMEIASIQAANSQSSGQGGEIRSDVLTNGSVFNDDAVVAVNVLRKNNNPELDTSPLEHVYLDRYEVVYFRTDGRNTEGVDVPYRITGPLGNLRFHTPSSSGEVEQTVNITVVRHSAKLEPPLRNLQNIFLADPLGFPGGPLQIPGQGLITTVAEITIHAHSLNGGDGLEAKGRVQITFGDFADAGGQQ